MTERTDLSSHVERVESIDNNDRTQMFSLMNAYYEQTSEDEFFRDLAEKSWAITLRNNDGEICGFSTQVLVKIPGDSSSLALFSGDTIVAEAYRNNNKLAGEWGRFTLMLMDRYANRTLYWFLISKGYKTYRYLPLFFKDYCPKLNECTPASWKSILDCLAWHRFGDRYDPVTRIVRSQPQSCRLRPDVAPILPRRMRDPHVAYFVECNPGHAMGDELCCLAPLHRDNFTEAAYRVIGESPSSHPS
jgi:hypothetical protein